MRLPTGFWLLTDASTHEDLDACACTTSFSWISSLILTIHFFT